MEKIKVSNRELSAFRQAATQYIARQGSVQNKLTYACQKLLKKTEALNLDFGDAASDARTECALIKDGAFVLDADKNLSVDPAKAKELTAKLKTINNKEVEVEPYITEAPPGLLLEWYQYFIPFVLAEYPEPIEEKAPEKKAEETKEPVI